MAIFSFPTLSILHTFVIFYEAQGLALPEQVGGRANSYLYTHLSKPFVSAGKRGSFRAAKASCAPYKVKGTKI